MVSQSPISPASAASNALDSFPINRKALGMTCRRCKRPRTVRSANSPFGPRLLTSQQGGIILAIDGLQPEKGHETLYLFSDTISRTNLLTQTLSNSSSDHVAALIDQVKAMGIPILGVVTDKQHSLVLAIDKVLPGIPHQLCQFHFFRNLAQPVVEADRAMKKHIKKTLRGIAPVERSLAKTTATEAAAGAVQAAAYCIALRATLQDSGKPPLDLGDLKMVERLQQIDRSLAKSQEKGGCLSYLVSGT